MLELEERVQKHWGGVARERVPSEGRGVAEVGVTAWKVVVALGMSRQYSLSLARAP